MLTLQYIPYSEIGNLTEDQKINKLLSIVRKDKIVLIEGKLKATEEVLLIAKTMEQITRKFSGIEIASIDNKQEEQIAQKVKNHLVKLLIGDREGMTVIGPANIIQEIRKNPNKIELYTKNVRRRK